MEQKKTWIVTASKDGSEFAMTDKIGNLILEEGNIIKITRDQALLYGEDNEYAERLSQKNICIHYIKLNN